jgi:hypothetical protein
VYVYPRSPTIHCIKNKIKDVFYNKYIKNNNENVIFFKENNTELINKIRNNKNIIFTKIQYLDFLNNRVLPYLNEPFVLVTHNDDRKSGRDRDTKVLNNPLLLKWYGINMINISEKTQGIPIGLPNSCSTIENFNIIKKFSKNPKNKLLYLNFSLDTNPERKIVMEKFLNNGFLKNNQLNFQDYMEDLSQHKFAVSPEGNGIDCYRTWECLYLGVIPIVKESKAMSFFKELPILFVDNYDDITSEFLEKNYKEKFINKDFDLKKLNISFWENEFKNNFKI